MEYPWIENARNKIGISEIKGPKNNHLIVAMWKAIKRGGIKNDETPWCSAFIGTCLEEAGLVSSRYESASSYIEWGVPCEICYGCIALIKREGGSGYHVTFPIGIDNAGNFYGIGGNQDNQVKISKFKLSRVKYCRWPKPVKNMKTALPLLLSGEDFSSSEA